jgi:hypothetical protein
MYRIAEQTAVSNSVFVAIEIRKNLPLLPLLPDAPWRVSTLLYPQPQLIQ